MGYPPESIRKDDVGPHFERADIGCIIDDARETSAALVIGKSLGIAPRIDRRTARRQCMRRCRAAVIGQRQQLRVDGRSGRTRLVARLVKARRA